MVQVVLASERNIFPSHLARHVLQSLPHPQVAEQYLLKLLHLNQNLPAHSLSLPGHHEEEAEVAGDVVEFRQPCRALFPAGNISRKYFSYFLLSKPFSPEFT